MMDDQQNETKPVRINAGKCDLGCTHIDFNPSWVFINRGGGRDVHIASFSWGKATMGRTAV